MMYMTNWKHWAVVGVAALTVMIGALCAPESVSAAAPDVEGVAAIAAPELALMRGNVNQKGRGPGVETPGVRLGINGDALLAEALGVSVDDLQAAQETARTMAMDEALAQAVTDGDLTQAQADAMKELRGLGYGRSMYRWPVGSSYDAYLAQALGITEDQLTAARDAAHQAAIEQAVADGTITQEQADELLTRFALRDYIQTEMETAYAAALQNAVADGIITQEQADELLSQDRLGFGHGMKDGFFGRRDGFNGMRNGLKDSLRNRNGFDDGMQGRRPGMRRDGAGNGFGPQSQGNQMQDIDPASQL